MPEGDVVRRTAIRLDTALAGRPLLDADLRWPGLGTADLAGAPVLEVASRGKHILTRLGTGWTLRSHLRMEGAWFVQPTPAGAAAAVHPARRVPGQVRRRPVRAVLMGPEWTCLGLRLGMLDLVRTADEGTLIGHLGPDVLDPGFDAERAVANLAAGGQTIGEALMDQRRLAGIGTLWACETLFAERVHPWTRSAELPAAVLARLVARARRFITAGVEQAVQSSTGDRRPGRETYVHARSGRPCRRCGRTVRVAMIGPPSRERTMFYCPGCQGGLAPTDDGAPLAPLGARVRGATGRERSR
ncbi:Fpg/Nei family DNA glycosylase [Propionicicella superfundia]|uniref:Fpg/Nei family DNA glycosylase n=1 Tax=Propionicicella superfundia TaxID=348582 RepID=UPI0003F5E1F1|nr:DNA-formamidopyrimidine glycosylase family protein [Propionicicella superfundia]